MLRRRIWLTSTLVGALAWITRRPAPAQEGNSFNGANSLRSGQIAPLSDQLNQGLRAVTPAQKRFVSVVVAYVERGRLPRALVNLVYSWALKRNSRMPFPYFEYALRVLAKRRGVTLP